MKPPPQELAPPVSIPPEPLGYPPGSFDERFEELAEVGYRVAFRIVGQREEARDITQDALIRAFSRWNRIEGHAAAWVGRVATNLALDHVRRRDRRRDRHSGGELAATGTTTGATGADERADLVDALRALPRRQREVVVLRYLADLPETEVAGCLGLTVGTVKSHAHRGLATLRERLRPRAEGGW